MLSVGIKISESQKIGFSSDIYEHNSTISSLIGNNLKDTMNVTPFNACADIDNCFEFHIIRPIVDMLNDDDSSNLNCELKTKVAACGLRAIKGTKVDKGPEVTNRIGLDGNVLNLNNMLSISNLRGFLLRNEVTDIFHRFHLLSAYTNTNFGLHYQRKLIPKTMNIGIQIANAYETSAEVFEAFRAFLQQINTKKLQYPDQTNFLKTFDYAVNKIHALQDSPFIHHEFKVISKVNVDNLNEVLDSLISCVYSVIMKTNLISKLQNSSIQKANFFRNIASK